MVLLYDKYNNKILWRNAARHTITSASIHRLEDMQKLINFISLETLHIYDTTMTCKHKYLIPMSIKTLHLTITDLKIDDEFFVYFPDVTNLTINGARNLSEIELSKLTHLTLNNLTNRLPHSRANSLKNLLAHNPHLPIIPENKVKHLNVHGCCTFANIETYTSLETLVIRYPIVILHPKLRELSLKSLDITVDTIYVYDVCDLLHTDKLVLNVFVSYNNIVRKLGLMEDEERLLKSFKGVKHIKIRGFEINPIAARNF